MKATLAKKSENTAFQMVAPTVRKTLFIVRGHPGSGKTTLGLMIAPCATYSADDWFEMQAHMLGKKYKEVWSPAKLETAHDWCKQSTQTAMAIGASRVAVCNTFVKMEQVEPYIELAEQYGYQVSILRCENDFDNVHDVPKQTVQKMKLEMESA